MHPFMIWYALEFIFLFYFSISNKKRKREHLPKFAVSPASSWKSVHQLVEALWCPFAAQASTQLRSRAAASISDNCLPYGTSRCTPPSVQPWDAVWSISGHCVSSAKITYRPGRQVPNKPDSSFLDACICQDLFKNKVSMRHPACLSAWCRWQSICTPHVQVVLCRDNCCQSVGWHFPGSRTTCMCSMWIV